MPTTLVAKLQLKPGHTMDLQNVPADVRGALKEALIDIKKPPAGKKADAVLLFVNGLAETRKLGPKAIKAVAKGGMLWIAYPKGTGKIKTDVNRDKLLAEVLASGWQGVRLIAFDDTWSMMRFRPTAEVGT